MRYRHVKGASRRAAFVIVLALALTMLVGITSVYADIPGGRVSMLNDDGTVRAAMPNPGTQEQDLGNITFPAPYNVFEFVVTCMACHGGTVDQNVSHGTNWAGSNMASSARDPIFRANAQIVNSQVKAMTGDDGASNLCFRCHSPNGWYSGRFNPQLAGEPDGSTIMHSPLLSTDDEGIMCEFCHRSMGNVRMNEVAGQPSNDAAFDTMSLANGAYDWPHTGGAYPQGPADGNPMGDNTMQLNDGMTYNGPRPGSVEVTYSDEPIPGTPYTGQTYAVYPTGWNGPVVQTPIGEPISINGRQVAYNPDGSTSTHFEEPADVPRVPGTNQKDYMAQAISIEHPTYGNGFIESAEFCGTCHDLSVPVAELNGMPEQRTYTEWLYSEYGDGDGTQDITCQQCHMPKLKHEYADNATATINPDPILAGWFPYSKDRGPEGGIRTHKFTGSNRDLPDMMSLLYPEVDLAVIGAETGRDVRIFPGMSSDRSTMWNRTKEGS